MPLPCFELGGFKAADYIHMLNILSQSFTIPQEPCGHVGLTIVSLWEVNTTASITELPRNNCQGHLRATQLFTATPSSTGPCSITNMLPKLHKIVDDVCCPDA